MTDMRRDFYHRRVAIPAIVIISLLLMYVIVYSLVRVESTFFIYNHGYSDDPVHLVVAVGGSVIIDDTFHPSLLNLPAATTPLPLGFHPIDVSVPAEQLSVSSRVFVFARHNIYIIYDSFSETEPRIRIKNSIWPHVYE